LVDQEKIHNQCLSDDPEERIHALEELKIFFSSMPDKQQAWNDLIRLTCDINSDVSSNAASTLYSTFSHVPDKQQVWNDLIKLTSHKDRSVRYRAAEVLSPAFSQVPDKQQAWNDLHRLTNDEDLLLRFNAANAIGSAFSDMPDKQQACNDLIRLTNDEDNNEESFVRRGAVTALISAFSQVPDKQQAWNDLIKLITDEDTFVKYKAAEVLGGALSQVPDKQQAWNDLIKMTNDINWSVRHNAASALGNAFSQVPDKQQTWNDLIKMTNDENRSVRSSSNYSLAIVSIFKASQAETDEDYKKELEGAIEFFEIAAKESIFSNPAIFCLPFYRSFHTIIFKKQEAREEVNKYLEEAKSAIEGSESKKQLLEAVENLAEALKEIQNLENLDLQAMKGELNFYRKYCDHAAELMKCTDEKAPFATEVLRKGLPILDRNLKAIIEEIQKKSKIACKESKGTEAEEIVCEINKEIQNVIVDYQVQYLEATKILEDILSIVKMKIPQIPENKLILSKIEAVDNGTISADKYHDLPLIISLMSTVKVVPKQEIDQIHRKIEYISGKSDLIYDKTIRIDAKLDDIRFAIFRIKLNSHNIISNLDAMAKELEKLNKIVKLNESFLDKLNSTQAKELNDVNNNIQDRLDDLSSLIDALPKNDDIKEILERLNKLKQSDPDILLQRSSGIASLISFFVMFAQMYQGYIC
jgi:HEAT repeat protein